MSLHVNTVTFDADEPVELAGFWAKVFGADDPEIVNPFCVIVDNPGGPNLMFIKVPESKAAKNRMHFDLHAPDADVVDAEAERLVGVGASLISSNEEHGVYWKTLRDPEGNEFCVGTPLPGHALDDE